MAINEKTVLQIEVAIPGYAPINGAIDRVDSGVSVEAIELEAHSLLNDLFTEIRKGGKG